MDNASQEIIFVMAILIAPMEQMEGLILIAVSLVDLLQENYDYWLFIGYDRF